MHNINTQFIEKLYISNRIKSDSSSAASVNFLVLYGYIDPTLPITSGLDWKLSNAFSKMYNYITALFSKSDKNNRLGRSAPKLNKVRYSHRSMSKSFNVIISNFLN